ncbi:MAG: response regulator [Thermomicrobiales bacterium]|nr:response regulator [Thermomicrobiales bacterium]
MTSTEIAQPHGPAKILVINDSPDFLQMMREILTLEGGYEVATLDQSEDLLLQISVDLPDMVILDIVFHQSPTGPALAAGLAEADDTRDLPVLFCTALAERDIAIDIRQDIESRNQRILFKPFDLDVLLSTVAEMLANTISPTLH